MVKTTWILLSCVLASLSFQQPLSPTLIEHRKPLLATRFKEIPAHLAISQSEISLFKRAPPERESHTREDEDFAFFRNRLLQEWDKLELSTKATKTKNNKRRNILRDLIKTVPYDSKNKEEYVKTIHGILGEQRLSDHRKQVNWNVAASVPKAERVNFASIWRQDRNRRSILRKQRADGNVQSSQQEGPQDYLEEGDPQDWVDYYSLDDAQKLKSMFEDLELPVQDILRDQKRLLLEKWDELDQSRVLKRQMNASRRKILKEIIGTVPYNPKDQSEFVKTIHDIFGEKRLARYGYLINRNLIFSIPKSHRREREDMRKLLVRIRKQQKKEKPQSMNESISGQDVHSSHDQNIQEPDKHQNQYYGYLGDYEANHNLHDHSHQPEMFPFQESVYQESVYWPQHSLPDNKYPHQLGVNPSQEPMYWPNQALPGSSTGNHHEFYNFDNPDHVASMFDTPSDLSDYHYH